jgi:MOSC domain-containing protein YiiM
MEYAVAVPAIHALFVSPGRGSGRSLPQERAVAVAAQGFEGCAHANPGRREVLFASKQHLDALGLEPGQIRENITVDGADVQAWPVGQRVRAGDVTFEVTMVCDPCQRMDDLRPGLRAQLEGKRGMLARIVDGGVVAVGDAVELL